MKTVNSLSGGKTSSYMAVHYPADYEVFSLVCIDDIQCKPKDPKIIQYVNDKLGEKYISQFGEFIATAEDDLTLYAMRDLEQLIGREITWVRGVSFDNLIKQRSAIPNKLMRFCTTELKMKPIFEYWLQNIGEVVKMGIGYRYDESERKDDFTNNFKYQASQNTFGENRYNWEEINWREGYFPLIDNKVFHHQIIKYFSKVNIDFPPDSNCVFCFWKHIMQLRKNFETNNSKMDWAANKESKGKKWKKEITYKQVKKVNLQLDFFYGTGSGCQAGYCTN